MVLALTGACSTTHQVARPSSLESFALIARSEGPIDIVVAPAPADAADDPHSLAGFRSGRLSKARLLGVAPAGLSVAGQREPHLLSLTELRGYDVTSHGQGAVEGLGLGFLAGVTVGALAGFSAGDDPPCDPNAFLGCLFHETAGDKALIGGIAGGLTGALSGLLVGALVGHTDHYVF